jgi:hypothetical protein
MAIPPVWKRIRYSEYSPDQASYESMASSLDGDFCAKRLVQLVIRYLQDRYYPDYLGEILDAHQVQPGEYKM